MPIRNARFQDIEAISSIFAIGFHDEEVVGDIMHPHRLEYPDDYLNFWRRRIRQRYWAYSHKLLVSYETTPEGGEKIIGAADWERVGDGWNKVWNVSGPLDPRNFIEPLVEMYNLTSLTLWPNRACDPKDINIGARMFPFIQHYWYGQRGTCWNLDCISVLPEFQKKGYGRELVKWGLEQAELEGVAASVLSAYGRENFYLRCGFDVEVGRATDGDLNPLRGRIKGGAIFFKDAEMDITKPAYD